MDGIFGILNEEKDKTSNSDHLLSSKAKRKRAGEGGNLQRLGFWVFSERVSDFSLRSQAIRPSDFFGTRRKVVRRGEENAWAPVSWSFDKFREVGGFILLVLPFVLVVCDG